MYLSLRSALRVPLGFSCHLPAVHLVVFFGWMTCFSLCSQLRDIKANWNVEGEDYDRLTTTLQVLITWWAGLGFHSCKNLWKGDDSWRCFASFTCRSPSPPPSYLILCSYGAALILGQCNQCSWSESWPVEETAFCTPGLPSFDILPKSRIKKHFGLHLRRWEPFQGE